MCAGNAAEEEAFNFPSKGIHDTTFVVWALIREEMLYSLCLSWPEKRVCEMREKKG